MFLFDELLSGTNSKDRRIAAEGLVRMMLARRAIGMVTTHDLALTEIAAIFPGQVRNVHLQDHVEDGQMRFDYKLRDGIITHSNALELMRMIGLGCLVQPTPSRDGILDGDGTLREESYGILLSESG